MPIEFRCNRCLEQIRVPDRSEGKKTRCPHCSAPQTIPWPQPSLDESPYETAPSYEEQALSPYEPHPGSPFHSAAAPSGNGSHHPQPMSAALRRAMHQKLLPPVITQLVIVSLGLVWAIFGVGLGIWMVMDPAERDMGILLAGVQAIWALPQVLAIIGLVSAIRLKSAAWAWAGMIIPIFSFPLGSPLAHCCCIIWAVPVGVSIWGIACLSDPKVRELFP